MLLAAIPGEGGGEGCTKQFFAANTKQLSKAKTTSLSGRLKIGEGLVPGNEAFEYLPPHPPALLGATNAKLPTTADSRVLSCSMAKESRHPGPNGSTFLHTHGFHASISASGLESKFPASRPEKRCLHVCDQCLLKSQKLERAGRIHISRALIYMCLPMTS